MLKTLLNPWVLIAVSLLLGIAHFSGYQRGSAAAENRVLAEHAREQMLLERVQLAVSDAIGKMEVRNITVRQEVQREIVEKPVYRDCVHDPRVMQLINAALTGGGPLDHSELPGAGAARGSIVRGNHDEAGGSGAAVP